MFQYAGCFEELATLYILDERGDIDAYGATLHTGGVGTVETTLGFGHGLFLGVSGVYLFCTGGSTIYGVKFVHRATLDAGTVLRLHGLAKLVTPWSLAVEKSFHRCLASLFGTRFATFFLHFCLRNGLADMLLQMAHLFQFYLLERTHALEHLVEINLVTIEFGTIYADKLGLSAHSDTAGATHACTIHHDGVQ